MGKKEIRFLQRFSKPLPLCIHDLLDDHHHRPAWTLNVSPEGMFVVTPEPLKVGQQFPFRLQLQVGAEIDGIAEVKWIQKKSTSSHPPGMGVEIFSMKAEDKEKLEKYIKYLAFNKPLTQEQIDDLHKILKIK